MKIIISHDVDHLEPAEHLRDGILARFIIRTGMEAASLRIRGREVAARIGAAIRGPWQHIDEVMDFDEAQGIPSTFFFGMAHGLGLSYGIEAAAPWIRRVERRGFKTGVHGIAYRDEARIREERASFASVSGRDSFGIRMHYLRHDPETPALLSRAGYAFDATPYVSGNPWHSGTMPVFPLHIMDGRFLQRGRFGIQAPRFESILARTKRVVRKEAESGTRWLSLLFHDRYFSGEFESWRAWYREMVEYFIACGHGFATYDDAIRELAEDTIQDRR